MLGDSQLHGLVPPSGLQRDRHPADALRGRSGHAENSLGLPLRLVDLLLLGGLRLLDDLLLATLGLVNLSVPLTLGREDHRPLLPLCAHLLLHGREHVLRWIDVLDLVAKHLNAPRVGSLVELHDHRGVDRAALLKRAIEVDFSDLAPQGRLGELADGKDVVADSVGGALGVEYFQVENPVHAYLNVVPGDTDLLLDVDRALLEVVLICDPLNERDEDMEPGLYRFPVLTQVFHDVRALLRNHDCGLRNDHDNQHDDDSSDDQRFHGVPPGNRLQVFPDRQDQSVDALHPASVSHMKIHLAGVPGAPCRTPQLSLARGSGVDRFGSDGDLPLQLVHVVFARLDLSPKSSPEEDERPDGQRCEEQPLRGDGNAHPREAQQTQDDGGGGKEYEIDIRRYDHLGDEEYRSDD